VDKRAGQYQAAIDLFTRALTLYPDYTQARTELEKTSESAARAE
jgi:tetratricopeptide (TPR) repeat protein